VDWWETLSVGLLGQLALLVGCVVALWAGSRGIWAWNHDLDRLLAELERELECEREDHKADVERLRQEKREVEEDRDRPLEQVFRLLEDAAGYRDVTHWALRVAKELPPAPTGEPMGRLRALWGWLVDRCTRALGHPERPSAPASSADSPPVRP
jgi:hypothetical protein